MNRHHVIEYTPQKDTPQILFLRARIKAEDLSIDLKALNARKQKLVERVNNMVRYIHETAHCRSRTIASYFGDLTVQDCGICDNCLRRKKSHLSKEAFDSINYRIVNSVKNQSIHTKDLLHHLKGIKKEEAWEVINFLQSENKIELDKAGWIRLK